MSSTPNLWVSVLLISMFDGVAIVQSELDVIRIIFLLFSPHVVCTVEPP